MKNELSLLNFNTLGTTFFAKNIRSRYKKIAEIIVKSNVDIVCLQEIGTYYNFFLMKRYLKNYPFCAYIPQLTGPKGGLVIFSKIALSKPSYHEFSNLGSLSDISFYTKILKNGVLICSLQELPLTIMTTHLVTDFEFRWSPTNKFYNLVRRQVLEAGGVMNKYAKKSTVILTGDFNMAKDTPLYKELLEKTDALDPFSRFEFPTYNRERLDYKFKGKTSDRIDYILVKQHNLKFAKIAPTHLFENKSKISGRTMSYLSDHVGLLIRFLLH